MNAIQEKLPGVAIRPVFADSDFPLLITRIDQISDLTGWAAAHRAPFQQLIDDYGALLFRGFGLQTAAQFQAFVGSLCTADWVEYREAATPRSHVDGHVFTSTEYYPDLRIYVHNENSHVTSWPLYIFFYCRSPSERGGQTPIADCCRIYRSLPADVLDRFLKTGWLYRRNFYPGSTMTWKKAFVTDSRSKVELYCQENHMTPQWDGDVLTVRYRRWAALRHPRTNSNVWFNHGTFFSPYTLDPAIKKSALELGEDRLPYCTYYGDGSAVEEETMKILDEAYAAETVSVAWQAGDMLMLDNMRIAHGRAPYRGRREVLVAMKHKVRCSDLADYSQYAASL